MLTTSFSWFLCCYNFVAVTKRGGDNSIRKTISKGIYEGNFIVVFEKLNIKFSGLNKGKCGFSFSYRINSLLLSIIVADNRTIVNFELI